MSAETNILIRADAGRSIGIGHFGRCAAVAKALLRHANLRVTLATSEDGLSFVASYFPEDVAVVSLGSEASASDVLARLATSDQTPDVIYLDRYGATADWEAAAKAAGIPLVVLDDLDEARTADAIVRPLPGAPGRYSGPAFLPLSRDLAREAPANRERPRLNICFGGSDPTGETAKALEAVSTLNHIDVDVVIGPGAKVDPATLDRASASPNITLHHAPDQSTLADLIATADLALGAGGVMQWERMCLGVPSIVVEVADNQRPQVAWMRENGLIETLGWHADVTASDMHRAIEALVADTVRRATMANAGRGIVDGRGAIRIAALLRSFALALRPVTHSDAEPLLAWRTAPENWANNWSDAAPPTLDEHTAWLGGRLGDPNCWFSIVSLNDAPVGVVRFDLTPHTADAYLSIYLVPEAHGRRLGLPVCMAAERALHADHPDLRTITSRIHRDNAGSERLHRDAGFELSEDADRPDWWTAQKAL